MSSDWLIREVCKLAAEITDEIERSKADAIDVELSVKCWTRENQYLTSVTEHVRRVKSDGGEWGGTERSSRERFA